MQPITPHDFLKVSAQRLSAAEEIMTSLRLNLESQYIDGYSVECSFKALILEKTPALNRHEMLLDLTRGSRSHRTEVLLGKLRDQGVELPVKISKRMRRFIWTTDLRYETGRKDTGETKALLKTSRAIYDWVKEQIP